MKAKNVTLLDIQKSIVLASANTNDTTQSFNITRLIRSRILHNATHIYTEKYGVDSVSENVAIKVLNDSVSQFVMSCGVNNRAYIKEFASVFIDQLKAGVPYVFDEYVN